MYIFLNLLMSRPIQCKPMMIKGKLYNDSSQPSYFQISAEYIPKVEFDCHGECTV